MGKFESRRENDEVEKAFRQVTGTPAPKKGTPPPRRNAAKRAAEKKKKMIILIVVCAVVLTLLIGLIVGLIILKNRPEEEQTIHGGVYAGSINLSGMTLEEAKNALHLATDHTFAKTDMIIKLPDSTITLSPEDTKVTLNVDAVAQAAFDYGRKSSATGNIIPLLPYLELDTKYIRSVIDDFCTTHGSVLVQPTEKLEGERPAVDAEKPEHQTLTIVMGIAEYALDAEEMYNQVLEAYSMNEFLVSYKAPQQTEPEIPDAQTLFEKYCVAPQDAQQDPDTLEITPEVLGYGFDIEEVQKLIDKADYGETLVIPFDFLTPEVTTETITGGVVADVLSQATATGSIEDEARDSNITKGCEKLNGYKIKPGATFSFNEVVGNLSLKNGFKDALVSQHNDTSMGGGVSQIASALYQSALLADLKIIERNQHNFAVEFAEPGLDAFVDGKNADLRFRNNTGSVIDIVATYSDGTVTIKLMGSNHLDYEITLRSEIIQELTPQTVYQQMAADNVHGYEDGHILQEGITGYDVQVFVEMKDKETGEIQPSFEVSSSYASREEIKVQIGSGETDDETGGETGEETGGETGEETGGETGEETGGETETPVTDIPEAA